MGGKCNYFLLNKASDYLRGFWQNMEIVPNGIRIGQNANEIGIFCSRLLDSRENGMEWHRLIIEGNKEQQSAFRLSVYAGNERNFVYQNSRVDLEEFICKKDISPEEKKRCLLPWLQKQTSGFYDVLLHEVKGRYLWFMIEAYVQPQEQSFRNIRISFPKQTWLEYLPEIYQKEDTESFLERYLGIFQTIYEDLNAQIQAVSRHFDMDTAQGAYLTQLAGWLDIQESYIWSETQLRYLIKNAVSMYKKRGTRQGIIDFVKLYTGEEPFLVEYHQQRFFQSSRTYFEKLNRLYGSDAYIFTVLVREAVIDSVQQKKTLMKMIEDVAPAHMECNLVLLKPYLFLDCHAYIGVNSVLGRHTDMALDGHSALSFAVLGAGQSL